MIYDKDFELKLQVSSLCISSDDVNHDTCSIHEMQHILVSFIKEKLSSVHEIYYEQMAVQNNIRIARPCPIFVTIIRAFVFLKTGLSLLPFMESLHVIALLNLLSNSIQELAFHNHLVNKLSLLSQCLILQVIIPALHFEVVQQEDIVTVREEQLKYPRKDERFLAYDPITSWAIANEY